MRRKSHGELKIQDKGVVFFFAEVYANLPLDHPWTSPICSLFRLFGIGMWVVGRICETRAVCHSDQMPPLSHPPGNSSGS